MSAGELLRLNGRRATMQNGFDLNVVFQLKTKKKRLTKYTGVTLTVHFHLFFPIEVANMPQNQRDQWLAQQISTDRIMPILQRHNIHTSYHDDMMSLQQFDIVMIADDSGSMNSREETSNMTRWEELKMIVKITIDLAAALSPTGLELLFLNRAGKQNVRSWEDVQNLFGANPSGSTPIARSASEAMSRPHYKPILLLMATDGEPDDLPGFVSTLTNRDISRTIVSILACSDREDDVAFLEGVHQSVKGLDVIEEFKLEKRRVHRVHKYAHYHMADHAARWLLGAIYPKYDVLDNIY